MVRETFETNKMNNNNNNVSNNDQSNEGSPIVGIENPSITCINEGQVSFLDAEPGFTTMVKSMPDATYGVGSSEVTDLKKWLSRPLEIYRYQHAEGSIASETFLPWHLFFNNSSVKLKLDHYSLLRCKLNVKIVVNAAPVWWGISCAAYQPSLQHKPDDSATNTTPSLTQRPHVFLNPTTSKGGCLCLPFFYNGNWLDVTDAKSFMDMGKIRIQYLSSQGLRCSTSPTSQNVEYTVFAWASDVELAQTTQGVSMQADEYATGPVSSVASSVANVAGKLISVPFLKPYAKATEIAATAIGKVAHIFGFSRTPVVDNPRNVKNLPFGQLANCGTHELVDRLVVDPKNELCIDSRTVGLDGSDEMTITSIATRESFLGNALWKELDAANDRLAIIKVTPDHVHTIGVGEHQPTPIAMVSRPFQYWRGDIIYRIVVAASKFHRGRLLVQWDPHEDITSTTATNLVATKILDLSISRDMEFRVPYAAHTPFLKTEESNVFQRNAVFRDAGGVIIVPALNYEYHNGSLGIKVLNPATGMSDSNQFLDVSVFVRGAENFEVAAPRNFDPVLSIVGPNISMQSGEVPDDSQPKDFSPFGHEETTMMITNSVDADATYKVCMGETVSSFRTLLKRYNYSEMVVFPSATLTGGLNMQGSLRSRWPLPKGRMTDGIDQYLTGPGNITNLTLFNYLQGAFVGMRGSSRWKFNYLSRDVTEEITVARTNEVLTVADYTRQEAFSSAVTPAVRKFYGTANFQIGGHTLTNGHTQMGVEVEAPQYSHLRFISASPYSIPLGAPVDNTSTDSISIRTLSTDDVDFARRAITCHHAVGDDFSFFFFLNTPVWYVTPLLPNP